MDVAGLTQAEQEIFLGELILIAQNLEISIEGLSSLNTIESIYFLAAILGSKIGFW